MSYSCNDEKDSDDNVTPIIINDSRIYEFKIMNYLAMALCLVIGFFLGYLFHI